jgi:DTW domain-containing protein YfiP
MLARLSSPIHPQLGPFVQRAGQLPRCERCAMHLHDCICAEIEPLALGTHVLVFTHRREVHKPTNTARLVPLALVHSEVRVVGLPEDRARFADFAAPGRTALLLYPTPSSVLLTRELAAARPLTLVVPDGNWRQARKMATHEPALAELPHVHLPAGAASRYRLREHKNPRFLATFEAIARALGVLEGETVQRELERVLDAMVERALRARGRCPRGAAS